MAGGQERILRRRIRSIQSTKKITRAMELIAASQIVRAQNRIAGVRPYLNGIAEVAGRSRPPTPGDTPGRVLGVPESTAAGRSSLVVVADRGLCGGYNANVLRPTERTGARPRAAGRRVQLVSVGRKAQSYFRFRQHRRSSTSFIGILRPPHLRRRPPGRRRDHAAVPRRGGRTRS